MPYLYISNMYWFLSSQIRSNMLITINCFKTSMPYSVMKDGGDKDKYGKSDAIEVAILKINL